MYLKLSCSVMLSFFVSASSKYFDGLSANCVDPNAVSADCATNCGNKCSDWNKDVHCIEFCVPFRCKCKEGYVYDENIHKCVQVQDCTPVCGENEELSNCANGGCFGARKCSEVKNNTDVPIKCVKLRPESCLQECVCKEEHLRNNNGVCVPRDECELNEKCNNPHEFWDTCPARCSSQTCKSIGLSIQCSVSPAFCKASCRCAKGFYRNDAGICIPEEECPKKVRGECPKDEEWDDCVNNGYIPQKSCTSLTFGLAAVKTGCHAGCKCRDDWLRTDEGVCVPQDQCPPNKCSGANEMWDDCINSSCVGPLNCSNKKYFVRWCEKMKEGACVGGCRCKFDYSRYDNGSCVLTSECP